jgi:hypothetical protein
MIQIEKDLITPGDECVFGGGKTLRDGLAQASGITNSGGALDFLITNAVILDPMARSQELEKQETLTRWTRSITGWLYQPVQKLLQANIPYVLLATSIRTYI